MPLQQGGKFAVIGKVLACIRIIVVHKLKIVGSVRAFIANRHIHDDAGNVAFVLGTRFPSVVCLVTTSGAGVSGRRGVVCYGSSPIIEVLVALGGIHGRVAGSQMVEVGAGGGVVAKTAMAFTPGVFLVPV